jgi:hypothetical protein
MERASTIYLYTSTPPLTCDGRRESQHMDTKGGDSNFTINCENQDLNTRSLALIPCQASCTSQRNQKSELMERASTIHLYTSTDITSGHFSQIMVTRAATSGDCPTISFRDHDLIHRAGHALENTLFFLSFDGLRSRASLKGLAEGKARCASRARIHRSF